MTGAALLGPADHAWKNLEALIRKARVSFCHFDCVERDEDGMYWFVITHEPTKNSVEIGVPSEPLDVVKDVKKKLLFPPKFVIDGNAWLWQYAAEIVRKALMGEET
jgi:hypothetical protein